VWQLSELAERLGGELVGDGELFIHAIAPLTEARAGEITFLAQRRYRPALTNCQADAVILRRDDLAEWRGAAIIVEDPYLAYARCSALFATDAIPAIDIHPSAIIDDDVSIGYGVIIEANVIIESGAELADGCRIGAGSIIGNACTIGRATRLMPRVTLYPFSAIGDNCLIHAGSVIGSDGFGFAPNRGRWLKIHQLGRVIIGNDVEIGANTTIDRGALGNTVIGNGVKLDNLIHIAHNVTIGDDTAMAACVGIAGSARIGARCAIGGSVGILGHLTIVDDVTITAMSLVTSSIDEPGVYSSGVPLEPNRHWQRNFVRFKQLDEMARRLKAVEQQLAQPSAGEPTLE
jgi:UDP-3-O-[3-hydroxymyristoyl] glucosamine N-acyltransferase